MNPTIPGVLDQFNKIKILKQILKQLFTDFVAPPHQHHQAGGYYENSGDVPFCIFDIVLLYILRTYPEGSARNTT